MRARIQRALLLFLLSGFCRLALVQFRNNLMHTVLVQFPAAQNQRHQQINHCRNNAVDQQNALQSLRGLRLICLLYTSRCV